MAADWVSPGAPAAPGTPGPADPGTFAPSPVATASPSGSTAAEGPPPVPVPLRPFTVGDLLDGGLAVLGLAPRLVLGLAAVVVLPVSVLSAYLTRDALADVEGGLAGLVTADSGAGIDGGLGWVGFVPQVLESLALSVVAVGLAVLVAGWYAGRSPTAADIGRVVARRAPVALLAWVFVHAVHAVFAVALFVPIIVPMTWYAVVAPVIALEDVGPWRALGRSYRLTTRRFGGVLGTCLLVALTDSVLRFALSSLALLVVDEPWGWIVDAVLSSAAALVAVPFVAGVAVLLYLDLRVRTEGLDIAIRAREVLRG